MSFRGELLSSFAEGWTPPHSGSIHSWLSENVALPAMYSIPGKFNVERSRYLVAPLDSLRNHSVRQVNIMAAVQSGKSLIGEIWLPYLLVHSNGNCLFLHHTDAASLSLVQTRINPLLHSIKELKDILPTADKNGVKQRLIRLPHVSVEFAGFNASSIHSRTIKTLIGDEVWQIEKGKLAQAKSRCEAFPSTKKILFTSQGGDVGDDWDNEFNAGTVFEWSWCCPHCSERQLYHWDIQRPDKSWAGMIWDKVVNASGKTDIVKSAATCRLECFNCKGTVTDTPANREMLNRSGSYVLTKEGSLAVHSYRWNAMANPRKPFSELVEEYLTAKEEADQQGSYEGLKNFYRQKLALPWNMNLTQQSANATVGEYDVTKPWPEESIRFLTVDCQDQLKEFYAVVRSWDKQKNARQLYRGILHSIEDIRGIQQQFNVKDQHVFLDAGAYQSEVYAACLKHGHKGFLKGIKGERWICWKAFMGRKADGFFHPDPNGGEKPIKKAFSTVSPGKPGEGIYASKGTCDVIQWSNTAIKDLFALCRSGKWGNKWEVLPGEDLEEFEKQLKSERKVKERERKTGRESWIWKNFGPNHYFDCEAMQVLAAHIHGIL